MHPIVDYRFIPIFAGVLRESAAPPFHNYSAAGRRDEGLVSGDGRRAQTFRDDHGHGNRLGRGRRALTPRTRKSSGLGFVPTRQMATNRIQRNVGYEALKFLPIQARKRVCDDLCPPLGGQAHVKGSHGFFRASTAGAGDAGDR